MEFVAFHFEVLFALCLWQIHLQCTVCDFFENLQHCPAQSAISDIAFLHDTIFAATASGAHLRASCIDLANPASWDVVPLPMDDLSRG
jgi:hypothetical protein